MSKFPSDSNFFLETVFIEDLAQGTTQCMQLCCNMQHKVKIPPTITQVNNNTSFLYINLLLLLQLADENSDSTQFRELYFSLRDK